MNRTPTNRNPIVGLICALTLLLVLLLIWVPVSLATASRKVPEKPDVPVNGQPDLTDDKDTPGDTPDREDPTPEDDYLAALPQKTYIPVNTADTKLISPGEMDAGYAILTETATGTVLACRLADERIYPASMTKVMTLIVACTRLTQADLSATVTVTSAMVEEAYRAGASRAGFVGGETVSVKDLLYGIALPSGADATAALAAYLGGNEARFVVWMNEMADALGMKNTHFVNTSGLHDKDHYSTARDVATMMAYAMDIPLCRQLLGARTYTTTPTPQNPEGITFYSTTFSRMSTTQFGAVEVAAGKTGYTEEARFCLVSYAVRPDGRGYILVTAGGSTRYTPVTDAAALYRQYIS